MLARIVYNRRVTNAWCWCWWCVCTQASWTPVDTHLSDKASASTTSVHFLRSLCDVAADAAVTSIYDVNMTSSEQLQPRRRSQKTLVLDSDASDYPDDLADDMQLLGVDRHTTTLPDLVVTTDTDIVTQDARPSRRPQGEVRCRLSATDKTRRKTSPIANSSVVVQRRLACNSRTKRRHRVHAVCRWQTVATSRLTVTDFWLRNTSSFTGLGYSYDFGHIALCTLATFLNQTPCVCTELRSD